MNFSNPEVWYIIAIFYSVFCWGLPMIGMLSNPWAQESNANYRKGVLVVSATFHVSAILAVALFLFLEPYLFVQS